MDKEELKKDVNDEFRKLSSRIDRIRAAFEAIGEQDRMEIEMEMENLIRLREITRQKVHDLTEAKDNWEYFRTEAETAEQELRLAVEDANSLLSRVRPG